MVFCLGYIVGKWRDRSLDSGYFEFRYVSNFKARRFRYVVVYGGFRKGGLGVSGGGCFWFGFFLNNSDSRELEFFIVFFED